MPIYEFECLECGHTFEYLARSSSDQIQCPGCKKRQLRKLISSFAFNSKDASGNITASSSSGCGGCAGGDCAHCGS